MLMKNKIEICFTLKFSLLLLLNEILVKFLLFVYYSSSSSSSISFFSLVVSFFESIQRRVSGPHISNYQPPLSCPPPSPARREVNVRGTRTRSRAHDVMTETLLLVDGYHAPETSGGPITFRHIAVQLSPSINHPAIIVRD